MKTKTRSIIGLKELREKTAHYIGQVAKGRSFTVIRRARPIFKIVPVDEWGDEGHWETMIDFTKIRKGGMPIEELLEYFRKFNESNRKVHS